ncbi:MAG: hypothetical protein APU95_00875 [Hadesarchaea archaeon YNP_N21]|jgi:tRNA 2-thiouridine synthesizing protein A|nr:MAG: hypothetical protein APU95_00875 [Hadesarchaea archaeon YNP_N21]
MAVLNKIAERRFSIDARGYSCPFPVILTSRSMERLSPGDILEVILDNPPSCETIPADAAKKGYKVHEVTKIGENTWKIVIEK